MNEPSRDTEASVLSATPLFGLLATLAATTDLLVSHGLVRSLTGELSHAALLDLARFGLFARNLAAIAGLVALGAALVAFLHVPRRGRIARALALAGFGGVFLPIIAVATVLPVEMLERRWTYLVIFAIGAANVLGVLLSLAAARRAAPHGIRIATGLVGTACFLTFTSIALGSVEPIAHSAGGFQLVMALSRGGELAWLLVPFVATVTVHPRFDTLSGRLAIGLGVLTTLGIAAAGFAAKTLVGPDFKIVVYGLFGGELFIELLPQVYLVVMALGAGLGVALLASRDRTNVQVGAAVLLLYAAGFAPQAPVRLLALVLAAAMMARSSITLGARRFAAAQKEREAHVEPSLEELEASLEPAAPRPDQGP